MHVQNHLVCLFPYTLSPSLEASDNDLILQLFQFTKIVRCNISSSRPFFFSVGSVLEAKRKMHTESSHEISKILYRLDKVVSDGWNSFSLNGKIHRNRVLWLGNTFHLGIHAATRFFCSHALQLALTVCQYLFNENLLLTRVEFLDISKYTLKERKKPHNTAHNSREWRTTLWSSAHTHNEIPLQNASINRNPLVD